MFAQEICGTYFYKGDFAIFQNDGRKISLFLMFHEVLVNFYTKFASKGLDQLIV